MMVAKKQVEIAKIADKIKRVAEKAIKDTSQENIAHLERLYSLEKHINDMKEWTFNIKALLTILTGLVLPVTLIMIEYLVNEFKKI